MLKRTISAKTWLSMAALSMAMVDTSAHAVVSGKRDRTCQNGATYSDYFGGTLTGDRLNPFAPFRVVIPDHGWNGKLLAYARGTGSAIKIDNGVPLDVDGKPFVDVVQQAPLLAACRTFL